jgi:hypothetical protein
MNLIVLPEADRELAEAIDYYNDAQPGLGKGEADSTVWQDVYPDVERRIPLPEVYDGPKGSPDHLAQGEVAMPRTETSPCPSCGSKVTFEKREDTGGDPACYHALYDR